MLCPGRATGAADTNGGAEGADDGRAPSYSCLTTLWGALNASNAKAGGTSALLGKKLGAKESWDDASIAQAVALASTRRYLAAPRVSFPRADKDVFHSVEDVLFPLFGIRSSPSH